MCVTNIKSSKLKCFFFNISSSSLANFQYFPTSPWSVYFMNWPALLKSTRKVDLSGIRSRTSGLSRVVTKVVDSRQKCWSRRQVLCAVKMHDPLGRKNIGSIFHDCRPHARLVVNMKHYKYLRLTHLCPTYKHGPRILYVIIKHS